MLEALGLDPDAEAVYRALLRRPALGPAELAADLGWSEELAGQAVERLTQLELVRPAPGRPGKLHPVSPRVGLAALLAAEEADGARRRAELTRARELLSDLVAEHPRARPVRGIEHLTDRGDIMERIGELAHTVRHEVCDFHPSIASLPEAHYESIKELDLEALGRGVRSRTIYAEPSLNDPAEEAYARWGVTQGRQVRTVPTLPARMIIVDGAAAMVRLSTDPEDPSAAVLHGPVAAALAAHFGQVWQQADVLRTGSAPEPGGLQPHERELLRILAAGHTDETAARRLGISVRTVRRTMAALCQRLDAQSRFQAGILAARQGWI